MSYPLGLTVLHSLGKPVAKTVVRRIDGTLELAGFDSPMWFRAETPVFAESREFFAFLQRLVADPSACAVLGDVAPDADRQRMRRLLHPDNGTRPTIVPCARRVCLLDFDLEGADAAGLDPIGDPEDTVDRVLGRLAEEFWTASYWVSFTGSTGIKAGKVGLRFAFVLKTPATEAQLRRYFGDVPGCDLSVFSPAQPIFLARPVLPAGVDDPVPRRSWIHEGMTDCVDLELPPAEAPAPTPAFEPVADGRKVAAIIGTALHGFATDPRATTPGGRHEAMKRAIAHGRKAGLGGDDLSRLGELVGGLTGKPDARVEAADLVGYALEHIAAGATGGEEAVAGEGPGPLTITLAGYLDELADPDPYLVDGIIPLIGTGLVVSDAGIGKSTLMKQIAAHAAAGRDLDFLGWKIPKPASVLYLLNEGSRDADRVRTRIMLESCGIDGSGIPFRVRRARVRVTLDSPAFRAALEEANPEIVVLDTFPRFVPGFDENSAKEWKSRVLDPLEALEEELGVFFFLIHHHGKPNVERVGVHKARGTSPMHGDVNVLLRLEAPDGKLSPRRELHPTFRTSRPRYRLNLSADPSEGCGFR